jgi:hypothetical protein
MKTQTMIRRFTIGFAAMSLIVGAHAIAAGIPEPGLVMYGAVRNTAAGNARFITGMLTWNITSAIGSPVTITTPMTDISGQYSYALRVPFESVVGSSTLSPNTLALNSATTSYLRTNVYLTVNGTNYPATISVPATGSFTFNTADRGKLDRVDLTVFAPGVGVVPTNPSFATTPHMVNNQFELTINGTIGQNYSLLASTDLVNWTTISVFASTNSSTVIYDPSATNFSRRFYQFGL